MKKNILLATMAFDIGGAETHILELAKGLKKRGYNVILASNGGVYVDELKQFNIKHFTVPMHNKKPWNVIKSYKILKKIIMKYDINIVHAHARIPGFICGLLYKKMDFKFVTTVHGTYTTEYGLKYITNWGQKALAVSEDIKRYLIQNYNMESQDIQTTINGVNTQTFSKDIKIKDKKILKAFSGGTNILHVSRLDESTRKPVDELMEAAQELFEADKNINIIIVGGGESLQSIKEKAKKINSNFSRQVIHVVGPRTNINEYLTMSKVFVGISRAALEAMASETPVVLAGYEGYMGIYGQEKYAQAVENNFTCRGIKTQTSKELLTQDILKLLALDEQAYSDLGKGCRNVIESDYSVERMVEDSVSIYHKVCNEKVTQKLNITLFGYIGFGNSGDEAILTAVKTELKKLGSGIHITAFSNSPKETARTNKIRSVFGFNPIGVIRTIRKSDLVMGSGGSLLQDETSTNSLLYYLSIISIAKLFNKKVILYANGIGPIRKKHNQKLTSKVVNKIDLITLRESSSYDFLKSIGVTKPEIHVTADPVFLLEGITKEAGKELLIREGIQSENKKILITFRPWENEDHYTQCLAKICDEIINEMKVDVIFMPLQRKKDLPVCRKMMSLMNNQSYIIEEDYSAAEMMGIVENMDLVLTMRLHALIYAGIKNVPVMGFVYSPKVDYYLNLFEMPSAGDLNNLDETFIKNQIIELLNNEAIYVEKLKLANEVFKKKCKMNSYYLHEFIDKNYK